jgi:hypothetical protein
MNSEDSILKSIDLIIDGLLPGALLDLGMNSL